MTRLQRTLSSALIVASCGLAACGGSAATTSTASTSNNATTEESTVLELAEMRLVEGNGKSLYIHADGAVEFEGGPPIRLHTDGRLVNSTSDELFLELSGDGHVRDADGKDYGTIDADGVAHVNDLDIAIDENGRLQGSNPGSSSLTVEGATTAGRKRAVMLVLIAITTHSDATVESVQSSGLPPVPIPVPAQRP